MDRFGLLGEKLSHSFSPIIHGMLGDYEYSLIERQPHELDELFSSGEFDGFNVTIPYKKAVIPYMAELSDAAKRCGSVNTVSKRADGSYFGDNTDFYGFSAMLRHSGIDVSAKKVLVLGDGGVAPTVREVLKDFGAGEIVTISRRGENNYENIARHHDAAVIVNTTPVGMYPNGGKSPVTVADFTKLEGVLDLIYNPINTEFMLQAKELGLKAEGGLLMLAAQAVRASERFTGGSFPEPATSEKIYEALLRMQTSVFLIGMPGCGKSTIGKALSDICDREFIDTDEEITRTAGSCPAEIITEHGVDEFRRIETEVLRRVSTKCGAVIATGGGIVTRTENLRLMRQNGIVVFLERELSELATSGRPLSAGGVEKLWEEREPLYRIFADTSFKVQGAGITADNIKRGLGL
ncbi:MAG: shikimate kinase [Ruminococcaceae bacterium]|nr:shikimate kinase [Oscillospiraceae bacterium]